MIDWLSDKSILIANPRIPREELQSGGKVEAFLKTLNGHLCIATSGTSGKLKWVALSKEAMLVSAAAVNRHLDSTKEDVWLNPLPYFHVGGLGIGARCFHSGARALACVFQGGKWCADSFYRQAESSGATLTSLVPAQVFDLVKKGVRSPKMLRGVIVGGAPLGCELYLEAVALGWELLPSYGLTECCSQVATAAPGSRNRGEYPPLCPLDHISLSKDGNGCLRIRSAALLTGYVEDAGGECVLRDPKTDGWFTTEDHVEFSQGSIVNIFRTGSYVKVGGEGVDLNRLEGILQRAMIDEAVVGDAVIVAREEERLGHVIGLKLLTGMEEQAARLTSRFNSLVFPYERIRFVDLVDAIPRTPLGKLIRR